MQRKLCFQSSPVSRGRETRPTQALHVVWSRSYKPPTWQHPLQWFPSLQHRRWKELTPQKGGSFQQRWNICAPQRSQSVLRPRPVNGTAHLWFLLQLRQYVLVVPSGILYIMRSPPPPHTHTPLYLLKWPCGAGGICLGLWWKGYDRSGLAANTCLWFYWAWSSLMAPNFCSLGPGSLSNHERHVLRLAQKYQVHMIPQLSGDERVSGWGNKYLRVI